MKSYLQNKEFLVSIRNGSVQTQSETDSNRISQSTKKKKTLPACLRQATTSFQFSLSFPPLLWVLTMKNPTAQLLKVAPPAPKNEPIIQLFSRDWRQTEPLSVGWLRHWRGSDLWFSWVDTQASEEHPALYHCYTDKRLVSIRQSWVTDSCKADGGVHAHASLYNGQSNESDWTELTQRQYLMYYLMICGGSSQTCELRTVGS